MTERTRAVIIDDRDSRVQLTGSWGRETGDAYNNQGRHGPVYRNTLTGSNIDGAKLSFTFSGTEAAIMGTTDPEFEDGLTDPDPNWDCVLDGRVSSAAKGASSRPGEGSINRWPLCTFSDLVPGEHTVELTVRTKGRTFWFDDIEYVPTDVVSGETIDAGQDDQDISYSAGWESYRGIAFITRVRGSTVTFPFSGTGIALLGNYNTDLSSNPSEGTYSIDGGSPVHFTIRGGSSDDYNRRLFEVSGLPGGAHTLVVTYQGSDGTMPLMVDRFFIEGGTNLRAQSSPTSGGVGGETTLTSTAPSSSETLTSSIDSTTSSTGGASATEPPSSGELPSQTLSGNPAVSSESGVSANSNRTSANLMPTATVAITIGVTLGVLALAVLLLLLLWLRRRRRIRLSSQSGELDAFFDPSNSQPRISQLHTPASSMSALSGTMLSYATPPHPEARSKVRIMTPQSATSMSFNRAHQSNFSSSSLPYGQSTVVPSSGTAHQASASISTAASGTDTRIAVLQHQDSGLRLSESHHIQTVEIPPSYSVQ